MVRGMIFDLDGTLIDSMGVWTRIDIDFLGKRGLAVPEGYLETITPMGFLNAARYTISRFGFSETPEELEEEWLSMAEHAYACEIAMKPGAKAFLEEAKALGMHLALATSSMERLYIPCLKNHGIDSLFEAAVTTRQAGEDKHSPKIYLMAAEQMGLKPGECIVFEDIIQGIRTAGEAGFFTAAVYENVSGEYQEEMKALADFYVESYEAVRAVDFLCKQERGGDRK